MVIGSNRGRQTCHFPGDKQRREKSLGILARPSQAPIRSSAATRPLLLRTTSPDNKARAHGGLLATLACHTCLGKASFHGSLLVVHAIDKRIPSTRLDSFTSAPCFVSLFRIGTCPMCSGMEMGEQLLALRGVHGRPKAIGERDLGRWRGKFWLLHFSYPTCRDRGRS